MCRRVISCLASHCCYRRVVASATGLAFLLFPSYLLPLTSYFLPSGVPPPHGFGVAMLRGSLPARPAIAVWGSRPTPPQRSRDTLPSSGLPETDGDGAYFYRRRPAGGATDIPKRKKARNQRPLDRLVSDLFILFTPWPDRLAPIRKDNGSSWGRVTPLSSPCFPLPGGALRAPLPACLLSARFPGKNGPN